MSSFRGSLIIFMIAVGLSAPALAQPKADAGSGPRKARCQQTMPAAGQRRAQSRIPTQRPPAIPTAQLKTAPGLRLALNQLEARSLPRRRRPKRSSSLCHKQGVYLYTLVMNSDPQKLQPCRDGQGCVERRR